MTFRDESGRMLIWRQFGQQRDKIMRNQTATQLLFEMSRAGRGTIVFPESDVPEASTLPALDSRFLAESLLPLPEIAEPDVVRHFVNLSTLNMSVDSHFYPTTISRASTGLNSVRPNVRFGNSTGREEFGRRIAARTWR